MAADAALNRLQSQHPEWAPWLTVVARALRGEDTSAWDNAVPSRPAAPRADAPALAGSTIALQAPVVTRLVRDLLDTAVASGTPAMASLSPLAGDTLDGLEFFKASLCQDGEWLAQRAETHGADPEAFQAVAALVSVPFLQACQRRWAGSQPRDWLQGYCPLCAGWPTLTEVRGIERSRHHRCGRCGSAWHARLLCCPFCGMLDHDRLVSLVPEQGGAGSVDACRQCRGYVKTFTRLQGCPPDEVMLEDLATVHLDIAALEQGYQRPSAGGCPLAVDVIGAGEGRFSATRP